MLTKDIIQSISKTYHKKIEQDGFESEIQLPISRGKGNVTRYDFGEGFTMLRFEGQIKKILNIPIPDQKNAFVQFLIMIKGHMVHWVDENFRYRLTEGSSAMILKLKNYEKELVQIPSQDEVEFILLKADYNTYFKNSNNRSASKEVENVFNKIASKNFFLYESVFPLALSQTLEEMRSSKRSGMLKRIFLESKALEIMWIQLEAYKNEYQLGYDPKVLKKEDLEMIKRAKQFISRNYGNKLTLSDVARAMMTNETKLKKGLKKVYGCTFGELLRKERLLQGRLLLEEKRYTVKEVSHKVGYKSESVFTKRFKEYYDILPSEVGRLRVI